MDKNNIVTFLGKLLKNFVFNDFDIKFDIDYIEYLQPVYKITVYLDPEIVCMSGDRYDPKYDDFLWNLEEKIERIFPYAGLGESTNISIVYKFLNEREFSKKLYDMAMGVLPKIYNLDDTLPKLHSLAVHQRGHMSEFGVHFQFQYDISYESSEKMYVLIHEFLPTFSDVYLTFN